MKFPRILLCASVLLSSLFPVVRPALAADANRLTYLDGSDPYYVNRTFPKLTTPQWVGEPGVDAVVVLAIDDMRDPAVYEKFLRPAIDRLKQIDGRAPISIMTCKVDPADPRLRKFMAEGLSLEVHTIDHPCPILAGGNFSKARKTYDDCVDLLSAIPDNRPVAFRTPCCDSKNTLSPRFLAEIFNLTNGNGNFLQIDSSVFHRFTAEDTALPRNLVLDEQSGDRYARYVPFPSFANSIRDYPYPYVIGKLCWEFPCITPSDWQSHNIQGDGNPRLIADWEAQLDATVIKQGVFTLVFHPYGWSKPEQIAELVDWADRKYGKRVKFLNFAEAQNRLNKNLLAGQALRADGGQDNGVRLLDLNNDGYLDVVIGNDTLRRTRLWDPAAGRWRDSDFPVQIVSRARTGAPLDAGARFGSFRPEGTASLISSNETARGAWSFLGGTWGEDALLRSALEQDGGIIVAHSGIDMGVRLRDIGNSGRCDLLVSNPRQQGIFQWDSSKHIWNKLPFNLPDGNTLVDADGRDTGMRFVDIDGDGFEDVIFSNELQFGLYLWSAARDGWTRKVTSAHRIAGDPSQIPPIVFNGTNNGAWFMKRTMWVQNEQTDTLPDVVDRRTFGELLGKTEPAAKLLPAALASIQTRPGFQTERAAGEPLVQDPIAFAWGPDGRFWVVEMADYPLGLDGKGAPGGRIRILEDTNGDGRYVKSTVFLDHVPFPTGVMPWGKGVLITAAPDIFYAEDTKRDGHCDYRKTLYSGFVEGNQQHRMNGLLWGLDNWVHGANGHSGGNVKAAGSVKAVSISGRDFRIRPDEGLIETETGMTQYGHTFDDWGTWFGCDNTNPMFQFVLEDRYLRRNPYLSPPDARVQVSDTPGASVVYATSRTLPRFNDPWGADHFTSANSVIVYRDDLFGPAFYGNSFVSEPVHDLVHREVMRREGVLFHSTRADDEKNSEFWTSNDNWSRPTMLRVGPDGALWIADMYRYVIEHPEWIPKDWQAKLDLRAGSNRGRIYRVFPIGVKPRKIPRLDALSTEQLVAALESPSGWQRDTIQQMLVQKKDLSATASLEKLVRGSANPLARLHALCTLDGLNSLTGDLLVLGLNDGEAGVRRHAIRLCEERFGMSAAPGDKLVGMVADVDPQVRLQLAFTLGEWDDARAGDALGRLAVRNSDDKFITAAVLSSVSKKNLAAIVQTVIAPAELLPANNNLISSLLKYSVATGDSKVTGTLVTSLAPAPNAVPGAAQFESAANLLDVLDASNASLAKLAGGDDPELAAAIGRLGGIFNAARQTVGEVARSEADRVAAVGLLGRQADRQNDDLNTLSAFLTPQTAEALQQAAVESLAKMRDVQSVKTLLANWKGFGPTRRLQVLDALLARRESIGTLLDAIESKTILAGEIDAPHRQRLVQNRDAAPRDRARRLLAETIRPDRQQVIDSFKAVLTTQGSAPRGNAIFTRACAACHLLGGQGHGVGPDLAGVGDKSAEGLMVAILDPNRAVEPQFVNYIADTNDGQTYSGVLRRESGNSVTLILPGGAEQTILRGDLKSLRSSGLSLMPEGLENGMSAQDLADVIAFVRANGPTPQRKIFDGNSPQVVLPAADGKLQLLPSTCEIFGSKIVLEKQYGNLGQWTGADDQAVWSIQPARAGTYEVYLHYACDNNAAGNTLLVQCGTEQVAAKVESTGNWDTYRRIKVGEIKLTAGRQRVTVRAQGPLRGALLDLRAVELVATNQG